MKRSYWDRIAANYDDEIFGVLKQDREGRVLGKIDRYGADNHKASDIGCGTGAFLPALSARFKNILAMDFSAKLLARAQEACARLPNVSYRAADLASPGLRLPKVDFALCVNALLTPSLAHRNRMLDALCRHVRPRGHLVLVVPSLESACLTDFRRIEWNLRDGIAPGLAARTGFPAYGPADTRRHREGVIPIDGVPTKHYLEEELIALLKSRGLTTLEIEKIEYPWNTEFTSPPRWMQAPFPWDWLLVAEKTHLASTALSR